MNGRSFKMILPFLAGALLLGVFAVANLLVTSLENTYALRADMTRNELYTLSDSSHEIVDNLSQNVSIYAVYFRGNEDNHVINLLAKYATASDKIFVQNVDPLTNTTFLNQFGNTTLGSQEGAVIVTNADGSAYRVIQSAEMHEPDEYGNVTASNAENKITSAIEVVTSGSGKQVRMLTGHKEIELIDLEGLTDSLEAVNFEVSSIDIVSENPNPEKDILVCISPKSDFTVEEQTIIETFVANGGTFVLFMDGIIYDRTEGSVQVLEEPRDNIHALLAGYGLSTGQDLVVGSDPEAISLRPTTFQVEVENHPITHQVLAEEKSVIMSEASSINIVDGYDITPLLCSSADSYTKLISELDELTYNTQDATGEFCLGVISENAGNVVLFSSSSFVTNDEISISGNAEILTGVCLYASPDMSVIDIPSKSLLSSRLDTPGEFTVLLLGLFLNIILPAGIALFGIRIGIKRKKL